MFTIIVPVYEPKDIGNLFYNLKIIKEFHEKNNVEVIIIDDGSKDRSYLSNLKPFFFVNVFRNKKNIGKAESVNSIIDKVETDYISILDDDDLITRNSITEKISYIKTIGGDLLIGAMQIINDGEIDELRYVPTKNRGKLINQLLSGFRTPFHLNAILFKKALFKKVGGMHPDLMRVQDVDLSVKLLKEGRSFSTSDSVHYIYYKHRSDYKSIFQLRIRTMLYRFKMILNNTVGAKRYYHLLKSFLIDTMKLVYSITFRY